MQESLRGAVAVEGGMSYFEPPRLFQPPRQCLGALLLEAARPAEAEAVCPLSLSPLPACLSRSMSLRLAVTYNLPF